MTAPRGPLPGVAQPAMRVMTGAWRGTVERVAPLAVSVPSLAGQGAVLRQAEAVAGLDPPLAAGDKVWVTCVEGEIEYVLVTHRRA